MTLPQSPSTLRELFNKALPQCIAIGMTPDQFWNADPELVKVYRKAHEEKMAIQEAAMWRQGLYIQYAVASCMPGSTVTYPEMPFALTMAEAKERERQQMIKNQNAIIDDLLGRKAVRGSEPDGDKT